jgi:hypothetical protein
MTITFNATTQDNLYFGILFICALSHMCFDSDDTQCLVAFSPLMNRL